MNDISHNINKKSRLKTKLSQTPETPGVYLHKNDKNEIIYVGKAKNLKSRLKSYFQNSGHTSKTQSLVENIEDFDFILTNNEYESIIAENNLIKHHKPKYNVLLKDGKTYPYLRMNLKDKWPQLTFTRKKKSDGALYFGPYPNVVDLDKILSVIHKFFPLVRCSKHTFKTISRPCNYYHIQQCLAPCHKEVDHKEYLEIVKRVVQILNGKTKPIIGKLKTDMKMESLNQNYEKAAKIRDSIKALESLIEEQVVDLNQILNIDCIEFLCTKEYFSFYVAYIRDGVFVGADSYTEALPDAQTPIGEILSSLITQFYDAHIPVHTVYIDDVNNVGLSNDFTKSLETVWTEKHEGAYSIHFDAKELFKSLKMKLPTQKAFAHLSALFRENAFFKLQEKIKIHTAGSEKILEVKNLLGLDRLPRKIECYDISTFQGAATVGSQVVFKDGMPCKSLYRKYIIRDYVEKIDDFAGLKEVLRRRLKDRNIEDIDLLMVDGGTPQVREVSYLFQSLGLDHIDFIGIAKQRTLNKFHDTNVMSSQERLIIPARGPDRKLIPNNPPTVIELDPHSKSYQLLVSLRDEAHRFAITFHRKRRDKLPD